MKFTAIALLLILPASAQQTTPPAVPAATWHNLSKLASKAKAGDKNVFYIPTSKLFGTDGEDTVDGSHPMDLGFLRMAENMAPVVRDALRMSSK